MPSINLVVAELILFRFSSSDAFEVSYAYTTRTRRSFYKVHNQQINFLKAPC